jgi:phage-related protein
LTAHIKTYIFASPPGKPVRWLGASLRAVRRFPDEARQIAGFGLWQVQQGMSPSDWKPMPGIGVGVREIRIRVGRAFRVIYTARFAEAVYVLHAFEKREQRTSRADLQLARERFRHLQSERDRGRTP